MMDRLKNLGSTGESFPGCFDFMESDNILLCLLHEYWTFLSMFYRKSGLANLAHQNPPRHLRLPSYSSRHATLLLLASLPMDLNLFFR